LHFTKCSKWKPSFFCRAMQCISVAYAVVNGEIVLMSVPCQFWLVRRTSKLPVRANLLFLCINGIIRRVSRSYSHIILVFLYQTWWQYSDGNVWILGRLNRASNAGVHRGHFISPQQCLYRHCCGDMKWPDVLFMFLLVNRHVSRILYYPSPPYWGYRSTKNPAEHCRFYQRSGAARQL